MKEQTVDLRPQIVNVKVRRGDSWAYKVTYKGTLVGATISAQIARTRDGTLINLTITPGDLSAGIFYVGQESAGVAGDYDIEITPAGGMPRTYVAGKIEVEADVTNS